MTDLWNNKNNINGYDPAQYRPTTDPWSRVGQFYQLDPKQVKVLEQIDSYAKAKNDHSKKQLIKEMIKVINDKGFHYGGAIDPDQLARVIYEKIGRTDPDKAFTLILKIDPDMNLGLLRHFLTNNSDLFSKYRSYLENKYPLEMIHPMAKALLLSYPAKHKEKAHEAFKSSGLLLYVERPHEKLSEKKAAQIVLPSPDRYKHDPIIHKALSQLHDIAGMAQKDLKNEPPDLYTCMNDLKNISDIIIKKKYALNEAYQAYRQQKTGERRRMDQTSITGAVFTTRTFSTFVRGNVGYHDMIGGRYVERYLKYHMNIFKGTEATAYDEQLQELRAAILLRSEKKDYALAEKYLLKYIGDEHTLLSKIVQKYIEGTLTHQEKLQYAAIIDFAKLDHIKADNLKKVKTLQNRLSSTIEYVKTLDLTTESGQKQQEYYSQKIQSLWDEISSLLKKITKDISVEIFRSLNKKYENYPKDIIIQSDKLASILSNNNGPEQKRQIEQFMASIKKDLAVQGITDQKKVTAHIDRVLRYISWNQFNSMLDPANEWCTWEDTTRDFAFTTLGDIAVITASTIIATGSDGLLTPYVGALLKIRTATLWGRIAYFFLQTGIETAAFTAAEKVIRGSLGGEVEWASFHKDWAHNAVMFKVFKATAKLAGKFSEKIALQILKDALGKELPAQYGKKLYNFVSRWTTVLGAEVATMVGTDVVLKMYLGQPFDLTDSLQHGISMAIGLKCGFKISHRLQNTVMKKAMIGQDAALQYWEKQLYLARTPQDLFKCAQGINGVLKHMGEKIKQIGGKQTSDGKKLLQQIKASRDFLDTFLKAKDEMGNIIQATYHIDGIKPGSVGIQITQGKTTTKAARTLKKYSDYELLLAIKAGKVIVKEIPGSSIRYCDMNYAEAQKAKVFKQVPRDTIIHGNDFIYTNGIKFDIKTIHTHTKAVFAKNKFDLSQADFDNAMKVGPNTYQFIIAEPVTKKHIVDIAVITFRIDLSGKLTRITQVVKSRIASDHTIRSMNQNNEKKELSLPDLEYYKRVDNYPALIKEHYKNLLKNDPHLSTLEALKRTYHREVKQITDRASKDIQVTQTRNKMAAQLRTFVLQELCKIHFRDHMNELCVFIWGSASRYAMPFKSDLEFSIILDQTKVETNSPLTRIVAEKDAIIRRVLKKEFEFKFDPHDDPDVMAEGIRRYFYKDESPASRFDGDFKNTVFGRRGFIPGILSTFIDGVAIYGKKEILKTYSSTIIKEYVQKQFRPIVHEVLKGYSHDPINEQALVTRLKYKTISQFDRTLREKRSTKEITEADIALIMREAVMEFDKVLNEIAPLIRIPPDKTMIFLDSYENALYTVFSSLKNKKSGALLSKNVFHALLKSSIDQAFGKVLPAFERNPEIFFIIKENGQRYIDMLSWLAKYHALAKNNSITNNPIHYYRSLRFQTGTKQGLPVLSNQQYKDLLIAQRLFAWLRNKDHLYNIVSVEDIKEFTEVSAKNHAENRFNAHDILTFFMIDGKKCYNWDLLYKQKLKPIQEAIGEKLLEVE